MKDMWTKIIQLIRKRRERMTRRRAGFGMTADHVRLLLMVLAITILSFLGVDIFYKGIRLQAAYLPAAGPGPPIAIKSFPDAICLRRHFRRSPIKAREKVFCPPRNTRLII